MRTAVVVVTALGLSLAAMTTPAAHADELQTAPDQFDEQLADLPTDALPHLCVVRDTKDKRSPSPTPSKSPSMSESPSASPSASPSSSLSESPSPTATPSATATPTPSPSPSASEEPSVEPSPSVSESIAARVGDVRDDIPAPAPVAVESTEEDAPEESRESSPDETSERVFEEASEEVSEEASEEESANESEEEVNKDKPTDVAPAGACPVAPTGLMAEPGMNEVRLAWSAGALPKDDPRFAEALAFYVSVTGPESRVLRTTELTLTVAGLRNGVEYSFEVFAATAAGRSEPDGPVGATPTTGVEGVVAGLIVEFADEVDPQPGAMDVPGQERVAEVDLTVAEQVTDTAVLVEFSEPVDLDAAEKIAADLAAAEQVEWAEPDQFFFTAAEDAITSPPVQTVSVPTDSQYATDQWNLWDTFGISVGDGATFMTHAWAGARGDGVNVAVIDTGITGHPDLDDRLVPGYDFVSNPEQLVSSREPNAPPVAFDGDYVDEHTHGALGRDANPRDPGDWRGVAPIRDSSWHGTKIAGLIAAEANDDGITGIAPNAKIQPIRALSWRGGLLSDIAASITWASGGVIDGVPANENPSKVINMSFAVETICPTALQQAIDGAIERGSILVAAAGNANDDAAKFAPGNCNGVITVGATNRDGLRTDYSNYGSAIDISAPGGDAANPIPTTTNSGLQEPDEATTSADFGTSISAAHVAAAAAILISRNAQLTPAELFTTLTSKDFTKDFANPTCDANPDYSCGSGILSLAQVATVASGDQDFYMTFNGSNQYARTAAISLGGTGQPATIEAWVRPTSNCDSGLDIVVRQENGYALFCENGRWYFQYKEQDKTDWITRDTLTAVQRNDWQHIAVTRGTGGLLQFFYNGVSVYSVTDTRSWWDQTSEPVSVGANLWNGPTSFFDGQIDELRLYRADRSGQISTDMNTYGPTDSSGLVAYYDLNEGPSGTTGTGTIYNRASGATSATNLRTVNGPEYANVLTTATVGVAPNTDTVVTFPRSYLTAAGGWRAPQGVTSTRVLVVGGGGGGGNRIGGGGGGGAVIESASVSVSGATSVTVGVGGRGGYGTTATTVGGADGGQSAFGAVTAVGGGGGGGDDGYRSNAYEAPKSGGGGGGGGWDGRLTSTGLNSSGASGAPGGRGGSSRIESLSPVVVTAGGGGGGAELTGTDAEIGGDGTSTSGGAGGSGDSSSITGTTAYYGGGGGGGVHTGGQAVNPGPGGLGGGAAGATLAMTAAPSGTDGLGGGGGGGSVNSQTTSQSTGGAGGSGVVIVRYSTPSPPAGCTPLTYSYVDRSTTPATPYTVVEFQGAGTCPWTPPTGVTYVDVLAVGGGGGGGAWVGGGGGGGGVTETTAVSVTPGSAISVTVGAGGTGAIQGTSTFTDGSSGGTSSFAAASPVTALGGGVGASNDLQMAGGLGVATGGGGAYSSAGGLSAFAGGEGSESNGGSANVDAQPHPTGGGGGAGGNGGSGSGSGSSAVSGNGGVGVASSITGASVFYGGGGGGSAHGEWSGDITLSYSITPGLGGKGGGGVGGQATTDAASTNVVGGSGTDGLGGGGGGGANYWVEGTTYTSAGGDGGDGVVIVRYLSNWLSLSAHGAHQPSNYAYSPSTANWVSAAPKVQLIDAAGNALTTSGVSVTATFTATSGSATLSNASATTVAGVADFSSLVLNGNAGTAGELTFSATGYGAVTSTSVAIVKAQQAALTITSPSTVVYNDTISLTTSGGSGTGAVSYQIVGHTGTSRCSISPSTTLRGTAAGTGACQVLASKEADANFEQVISPIQLVTVTQATQLISFAPLPAKAYGDTSFSVSATTTSGLTVAFSSISASVCSIAGNTVTILAAGTCTIRASQAGNANYSAATPVDQSFTVSTRSITLTADNDTFTYGGSASPGFSVTSGALVGSDAILSATYSYAGTGSTTYPSSTTAPSNAGTYSVTPSAAVFSSGSASNYTINYVAGSLTISKTDQVIAFTSSPVGTDPNDTYTPTASVLSAYSGSASGLSATFVIASSSAGACTISAGEVTFVTRNSSCVIEATALGDNNFNAQTTAVTQTIVIGALNQTITFARPANVAFGSSSQQMSATASSGLTVTYNVDTSQLACDVAATGVVTIKAVGACAVTAVQAGNGQYAAASSVTQTFQVVAVLPTAPTLTYASPASQSITAGFSAPGFTGGVSITGYSMVARVGGVAAASTTCASSPCTITGLVNGTNYTVTVAAINSAGTGPASTPSGVLTPYTSAFAVGGLTPTPGDTVMDLTWIPLTNAQLGGGAFTRYEVSFRNPALTSTWTLATNALTTQTTSSYQVTGLTNGISYDFQAVAITTANDEPITGNTAQVVQYPSTVPSLPLSLSVLPVAGSSSLTDVQFSWSAPLSDGGAALTNPNYSVTVTGSAGAAPVTCTPPSNTATYCTASGLTNGASYTFSVVATNRMGNSPAATRVYNVPSADATLSDLVVTGTGGAVSLAPSFAAGTTSYTASVTNAVASVTVTPTTTAAGASVTVDGVAVTSGSPSPAIALNVGSNVISVVVTAADPSFTQTYTITITRQAASGGGGSGGSSGGSGAPTVPVMPPSSVMNGGQVGGVLLGGSEETDVVWVRTSTNSGWEAMAPDFTLSVDTESRQRAPEPLLSNGAMQVPQGGFVVVNATGYAPQSTMAVFAIPRGEAQAVGKVAARAMTDAIWLGSATVGASGRVSITLSVPMTMDIGDYVLQINGESTQAQLRSVNLQLVVVPGSPVMTVGLVQRAGFYEGLTDEFTAVGERKLRSLVRALPKDAQAVQVQITGVSVSLADFEANLVMAGKRAAKLAKELRAAGVSGEYTVNVSATFTVDAAERTLSGKADVLTTKAGKPLSTVTVLFQEPVSP